MSESTFDVRLLHGEFCCGPFVALRSIDGASVDVAEVDKCAFNVCGQRPHSSAPGQHHSRPRADHLRVFVVYVDVHQHQRRPNAVDVCRITGCKQPQPITPRMSYLHNLCQKYQQSSAIARIFNNVVSKS